LNWAGDVGNFGLVSCSAILTLKPACSQRHSWKPCEDDGACTATTLCAGEALTAFAVELIFSGAHAETRMENRFPSSPQRDKPDHSNGQTSQCSAQPHHVGSQEELAGGS